MTALSISSILAKSKNVSDLTRKLSSNENIITINAWLVGNSETAFITRKPGASPIDSIADECSMMAITEDELNRPVIVAKSINRIYEFGGEFGTIHVISPNSPVTVEEWLPGKCAISYVVDNVTYVSTEKSVYGNESMGEPDTFINRIVSEKLTSIRNPRYERMKQYLSSMSLVLNITPSRNGDDFDVYLIDAIDMNNFSSITDYSLRVLAKELGLKTPRKITVTSEKRLTKSIGDLLCLNPSIKGVILKNKYGERDKISIKNYDITDYINPLSTKYVKSALNCITRGIYFGKDNELTTTLKKAVTDIEKEVQIKYDEVKDTKLKRHFFHKVKDSPFRYLLVWMRENDTDEAIKAIRSIDCSSITKHIMREKKEEINNFMKRNNNDS
jgi:hypothetical protein